MAMSLLKDFYEFYSKNWAQLTQYNFAALLFTFLSFKLILMCYIFASLNDNCAIADSI